MVNAMRSIAPEVKIVGMSAEVITGADINLGKDSMGNNISRLGKVVTDL